MRELNRRDVLKSGAALCGAGVITGGLLAGCGSTSTGASKTQGHLTEARLATLAKQEGGQVNFYTPNDEWLPLFNAALKDKYPWLSIKMFGGTTADIASKFLTESRSGVHVADVVQGSGTRSAPYRQAGAISKNNLPNDSQMPAHLTGYLPYLHPLYQVLYVLDYSKTAGIDPPKDLFELGNAPWHGKLTLDRPSNASAAGTVIASRRALWGDKKWKQWLEALKGNDILFAASAGATYTNVLQGERPLALDGWQDVLSQKPGTPVAAFLYQDVVVDPQFAMVSNGAPHPYTAQFFTNWLMSQQAQQILAGTGRTPAANIDSPISLTKLMPKESNLFPVDRLRDWYEHTDRYLNIYAQYWPQS